ncbi:MAG: hypothetical protein ACLP8A_16115 [Methylovirgula sp.]
MSIAEVLDRKAKIDAAIAMRDATRFSVHLLAWLEATAFLRALPNLRKAGIEPKEIPAFEAADLRDVSVRKEADDAVMAFCIGAGLARDAASFKDLDRRLTERFGIIYPGSSALYHCNQIIDPVVSLDDAVGQILKSLFEGASLTPSALWDVGLRLLQRLRSSSFEKALAPLLADFLRCEWRSHLADHAEIGAIAQLKIIACLEDDRADQPFIAALLLASADAVDALPPEYLPQLAKLAERP